MKSALLFLLSVLPCLAETEITTLHVGSIRGPSFAHYDTLPTGITGTNLGTVFEDTVSGGYWVREMPPSGSVSIETFGARTTKDSTTNIQAAFNGMLTDSRITKVTTSYGTYPTSGTLHLWHEHAGLEIDFGNAWLLLTNQVSNPDAMVQIHCGGTSAYGDVNPGRWALRIRKLNLNGGLLTAAQTGSYDEIYLDYGNATKVDKIELLKAFGGLLIDSETGVALTDGLENATIDELNVQNIGGSGLNIRWPCYGLTVGRVTGYRIGSHTAGVAAAATGADPDAIYPGNILPSYLFTSIESTNCNTLFDFSGVSINDPTERAGVAVVTSAKGKNVFGRTKVHGNWDLTILRLEMDGVGPAVTLTDAGAQYYDNTGWYPAFSVVNQYVQSVKIGDMIINNAPATGFSTSTSTSGSIVATNVWITNCFRAVVGSQTTTIQNLTAVGCRELFTGATVGQFYWEDAKADYWARIIGNQVDGNGGYSDGLLYISRILQGTSINKLNFASGVYSFSNGTITNLGPMVNTRKTASFARSANVATITTGLNHRLQNGDSVTITALPDATFNVTATATVTGPTTLTIPNAGDDVGTTASVAGTVKPSFSTITVNTVFLISTAAVSTFDNMTFSGESATDANYVMAYVTGAGSIANFNNSDFTAFAGTLGTEASGGVIKVDGADWP